MPTVWQDPNTKLWHYRHASNCESNLRGMRSGGYDTREEAREGRRSCLETVSDVWVAS